MYDYTNISREGIRNVIINAGFCADKKWDKERVSKEADMLIARGDLDEIDLILEESGE